MPISDLQVLFRRLRQEADKVIVGLEEPFELLIVALLTGGHVLLEGVPGTAKTLMAKTLAQLVQALLERELRQAMEREKLDSLPLYPEGRPCRYPTTRKLIDLFQPVQRHTLTVRGQSPTTFATELTSLQRRILKLLNIPANTYGR